MKASLRKHVQLVLSTKLFLQKQHCTALAHLRGQFPRDRVLTEEGVGHGEQLLGGAGAATSPELPDQIICKV